MTELIFGILNKVGFTHPLHPALTHIPMGMVMGAFFFGLAAVVFNNSDFTRTARHCVGLGLIFILPTMITGYFDWQHSYDGEWEFLIILKIILAFVLAGLLGTVFKLGSNEDANPKVLFIVYVLCLMCAVGLGFSGGELVFG
ncbi:MAG: hypothetical protein HN737_01370 [Desulfobacterales bacterium]|nr:hypothetical protein [Desulfobacterales bacterium]